MKIDMHIEKSSFFVAAWTFFPDSGRPWKKISKPPAKPVVMIQDNEYQITLTMKEPVYSTNIEEYMYTVNS